MTAKSDRAGGEAASSVGDAARRPLLWWDIAVAGLVIVMSVPGGIGAFEWGPGTLSSPRFVPTVGVLVVLLLLYAVMGRPAILRAIRERPTEARDLVFLLLLVVLLAVSTAINPSYATLQGLAYPMLWTIVPYGRAVVGSALFAFATGVGSASAYSAAGLEHPLWTAGMIASLSFVFAVAMGTWITRIFTRGEQHRVMAEQLREAQAELAELSAVAGAGAERERLSRELHDTLTQTLTGLVMMSEQAERALAADDRERARDRMARVREASRAAVAEARALVATTQPLGDGGLEEAIERVAGRLREDTEMRVACDLSPLVLDRELQVVLLRAAQEGLANARKHSRASSVRIRLHAVPETEGDAASAILTVEDDGVGFDAACDPRGVAENGPGGAGGGAGGFGSGFGLSGLRDRVRLVGGEVSIDAVPGGGARLEVRLPLTAGDPRSERTPSGAGGGTP